MLKRNNGFTLVEMIVVIAIIGIMSAIAVPNIYSFAAGMNRRAACRDLYSTLQKTRMNAIRQQDNEWSVEFTSSMYKVEYCDRNNVCKDIIKTNLSKYPGINIAIPAGTIVFNPDGTVSKLDGTAINTVTAIFTDAKGYPSQVEVFASGRIKSS